MSHIRPLVKYHGGKGRLHQWIVHRFPPSHRVYVEPFGGAASVLLNKKPVQVEIYNELEPQMFNLMSVIRNDFDNFFDRISTVKYSKENFLKYLGMLPGPHESDLARAVVFYIVKRMSRGGLCERFSWSDRVYSTGPAEEHCWNTALANIRLVSNRLQNVTLLNKSVFDMLGDYLSVEDCLVYLDPPYLTSTRVLKKAYDHEFSLDDHKRLADMLVSAKAKILLSGYDSPEYDSWFAGWNRHVKDVANHSSQHNRKLKVRKHEVLWSNYSESM